MSSLAQVWLRLLPLLLPISQLQRSTLQPLFSTLEAVAPSFPFRLSLFLPFSALLVATPTRWRLDWRGYWYIAAPFIILTQRLVDYFAVYLLGLGAERGSLLGCLLVESGYAFVRAGLIIDFILSLRVGYQFRRFLFLGTDCAQQSLSHEGALEISRDNLRVVSGAIAVTAASTMIPNFPLISQSYLVSFAFPLPGFTLT